MRIFITGASGFIGRAVAELLCQGKNRLLFLAKDKSDCRLLDRYRHKIVIGDLKNITRIKDEIKKFNPQVFIHLAWEAIPDFSFRMCKRNLDNSLTLANFIINETGCKKIIVSGSCLEYGRRKGACKESEGNDITSFLSWAKHSLYSYLRFICRKMDKDLIWFRIFYAYGPGQRRESLIPGLIDSFKKGVKPDINNPLNANDFIHVMDIAQAFGIAASKKVKPGIYNLGSGQATKVIDICKTVEKIIHATTLLSEKIGFAKNPADVVNFWADIAKTRKNLSWKPGIALEQGIKICLKEGKL